AQGAALSSHEMWLRGRLRPNGFCGLGASLTWCRDFTELQQHVRSLMEVVMQIPRISIFVVAVVAFLGFARDSSAQNNITQQKIGQYTYYGGTYDGKPVSGSSQQIGNYVYYNLTIDGHPLTFTRQTVGSQTYTTGPNGATSTTQRVGSTTYTTGGPATYTRQTIGSFVYINGSNGCHSTIQTIGSQAYTTGNC